MSELVALFVVTFDTFDYPGLYVVREQRAGRLASPCPEGFAPLIDSPGVFGALKPLAVVSTLEKAREALPPGLVRLSPSPHDDRVIVEIWL